MHNIINGNNSNNNLLAELRAEVQMLYLSDPDNILFPKC